MGDNILMFTHNWNNKLYCDYFTTLRMSDKYVVGSIWQVQWKGAPDFMVKVIDRKVLTKPKLNEWICRLDTGYSLEETLSILHKMYPWATDNTPIYFILLKRLNLEGDNIEQGYEQESIHA